MHAVFPEIFTVPVEKMLLFATDLEFHDKKKRKYPHCEKRRNECTLNQLHTITTSPQAKRIRPGGRAAPILYGKPGLE
jgi:hypothetical protein